MSIWLKSTISLILLAQVTLQLYSMLEVMGREKSQFNPRTLRRIHIINGYIFLVPFLMLTYYCILILRAIPGEISNRVLWHSLLAIGVFLMLTVKILFIRRYKRFMAKVPALGLTIFFLTAGMVATSGGYYFVSLSEARPASGEKAAENNQSNVMRGQELFTKWCSGCHDTDNLREKFGPSLQGILKREKLPVSGRTATPENIRRQLLTPYKLMPPQNQLKEDEIKQLIEFLKTI